MPSGAVKKKPANPAKIAYARIPTRSKASDPRVYTKTPHAYGDILIKGNKLGGPLHRDILYWVERHTWGTNVSKRAGEISRPEYAKLSILQLAKLCGDVQPTSVAIALTYLIKHKIIEVRDRTGCDKSVAKMYKLTPEHWKDAPSYLRNTAAVDDGEEDEQDGAPEDETQGYTVAPGAASRPHAVSVQPKDGPAITVRVSYSPVREFPFPVRFHARSGKNGRLHISATPQFPGEEKAKSHTPTPVCQFAISSPSVEDNKRFNEFDVCVNSITRDFWNQASEDDFVRQVVEHSAGAPVELFDSISRLRLKRKKKDDVPGLLRQLAAEAGRKHAKNVAILAQEALQNAPASPPRPLTAGERLEMEQQDDLARQRQQELDVQREAEWAKGLRCSHCEGTGNVSAIAGVHRNCGGCKGTGWVPR